MKWTARIALALLLTLAAGCHRHNKEAQLRALDEAYRSGVFTKEEYDAKRQAIMGPAAPAPPVTAAAPPAPAPVADPTPPVTSPPVVAATPVTATPPVPPQPPVARPKPVPVQQAAPPPVSTPAVSTPPEPVASPPAPVRQPVPPAAEPVEVEPAPLAGCQDAESRAGGPNAVQERFLVASEDSVRQAALQAFANLDFTVHRSTDHEIEASKKRHLSAVIGAGGERVILHFSNSKKNGQAGTKVTAETKKTFTGKLAQKSWTSAVLAQIMCNLRGR